MDKLPKLGPKMIELLLDIDSGRVFARRDDREHWFRAADDDQDEDKRFAVGTARAAQRHGLTYFTTHNPHLLALQTTDLGDRVIDHYKAQQASK